MYSVEIQGLKFGKIISRRKKKVYDVNMLIDSSEFSDRIMLNKDILELEYFTAVGCDRVKIFVDDEEWINKSLLKIDFSNYKVGEEYEFSDDMQIWNKNVLLTIDEDSKFAFKTGVKDSGIYSWWRYAREII